jgi:hypothetical protein
MLFLNMQKFVFLMGLLTINSHLFAQGFVPPAKGKSVVYLVRPTSFQKDISTLVFDGDNFIADFQGTQYFRYECAPGKHTFWVSAENIDFVVADLKEDASYVVYIEALAGTMMPRVKVSPMPVTHRKFHTAKWLIVNKPSITEDAAVIRAENERMAAFIARTLATITQSETYSSPERQLNADMDVAIEKFQ